ncbi:MAG: ABC transporter permease [Steroidobacteraceae bacterium]|nr:ABC transporter permease [Steroidobacteraceae bacterium]
MYTQIERTANGLELTLRGAWRAANLAAIDAELASFDWGGAGTLVISGAEVELLDLSGAWRLRQLLQQAAAAGTQIEWRTPAPELLQLVEKTLSQGGPPVPPPSSESEFQPISALGEHVMVRVEDAKTGLDFIGRVAATSGKALASWRRLRPISVARHIYDTGITAVPIVSLIAFLITIIIAYISAEELRQFGAEIYVVDTVTIGVLRELGVLLTAIIVAGRSGSAFAAELGAMKLNEEVDALRASGVNPIEVLVLPRVTGLVIALPLLTVVADAIGLTAGAVLCYFLLDMPIVQYLTEMKSAIGPTTFWVGVIKAPVFALLIALSACYRGLQVRDSSRELGRLTTVAVVQSIFLVILADAIFAVVFWQLDI